MVAATMASGERVFFQQFSQFGHQRGQVFRYRVPSSIEVINVEV
jgi:hypothetical protein